MIDEIVSGGLVIETNMQEILETIEAQTKFARQQTEIGAAAVAAQAKLEQFASSLQ